MIRSAKKKDVRKILRLQKKAFGYQDFKNHELHIENLNPFEKYLVVMKKRRFIGYINFRLVEDQAEIIEFAIKKRFQNQGYGKALLKEALEMMKKDGAHQVTLEVRKSNLAAQHLYLKSNFENVSVRHNYYGSEDGLLFLLKVKE